MQCSILEENSPLYQESLCHQFSTLDQYLHKHGEEDYFKAIQEGLWTELSKTFHYVINSTDLSTEHSIKRLALLLEHLKCSESYINSSKETLHRFKINGGKVEVSNICVNVNISETALKCVYSLASTALQKYKDTNSTLSLHFFSAVSDIYKSTEYFNEVLLNGSGRQELLEDLLNTGVKMDKSIWLQLFFSILFTLDEKGQISFLEKFTEVSIFHDII